jgi:hypothetical protein
MSITASDVAITAGSGTNINTVDVTNGGGTDKRQVVAVGGPNTGDLTIIASVLSALPGTSELGLTVREAAQGQTTMANSRPVVIASDQSIVAVLTPDLTSTGNITTSTPGAGNTVSIVMSGRKSAAVAITGTWGGTIVFEGSLDGSNWISLDVWQESTETWVTSIVQASSTTTGQWWFEPLGVLNSVRVRATTGTSWSGTAACTLLVGMGDMNTPEFVSGTGSTLPNNCAYVGGTDGTNFRGLSTTTAGVLNVAATPQTTGGCSIFNASVTTAASIKSSAGQIYGYHILNTTTANAFVQIFNVASGSVTLGTTAPTLVLGIPAGGGAALSIEAGVAFSTAITIAATTTRNGSTTAACECTVFYK